MVRKIQSSEYLKRYDNMTAGERAQYERRVGEWLAADGQLLVKLGGTFDARLQNVLQVSSGWNDRECQAFDEGAKLLSALTALTDTWLPDMLYIKSAKRAIMTMYTALNVTLGTGTSVTSDDKNVTVVPVPSVTFPVTANGAASVSPDAKPTDVTQVKQGYSHACVELPVPVRPKHIDQYIHLLPEKTQERAAKVKDMLRELDGAREKMRLLMDDPTAKDTDRESWAKLATNIDNRLRKIYDELDAEWAKLVKQGRVVVDDLGNARVVNEVNSEIVNSDAAAAEEQTELTSEQKARRRELRKWLVDTRRGNGDTREEHVKKWQENFKEFLALEGDAAYDDEKIKAAAAHYGIELTQISQISQIPEETQETQNPQEPQEETTDEAKSSNQSNELDQNHPTDPINQTKEEGNECE